MLAQVVMLGAVAGFGLLVAARGLFPPRAGLDDRLFALGQENWSSGPGSEATSDSEFGRKLLELFALDLGNLDEDLKLLERSREKHVLERVKTAALFAVAPPFIGLVLPLMVGTPSLFPAVVVWPSPIVGAIAGWLLTDSQVRSRARERRQEFDGALATYLGVVAALTAAGSGLQEAMVTAVDQGRGWAFQIIRRALADAATRGVSPWLVLDEVGRDLQLSTLVELASTFQLAGSAGARLQTTVMTKAEALRVRQLAAIEAEANAKTAVMNGPTGLMLAGFLMLLMFPALVTILTI